MFGRIGCRYYDGSSDDEQYSSSDSDDYNSEGLYPRWLKDKNVHNLLLKERENMRTFRDSSKYCDVSIGVGEETFSCHRVILASVSRFFDKMFDGKVAGSVHEIVLTDLDGNTFEEILRFAYSGLWYLENYNKIVHRIVVLDELSQPTKNILYCKSEAATLVSLHQKLDMFRNNRKYCDLIIRIKEQTYYCHRIVLAAFSSYFDSRLTAKSEVESIERVTLENVVPTAFKMIVKYAYSGLLKKYLGEDIVPSLLSASDYLGVTDIYEHCFKCVDQWLDSRIGFDNAGRIVEILRIARAKKRNSMVKKLNNCITQKFCTFVKNNGLAEMSFDTLKMLLTEYRAALPANSALLRFRLENIMDVIIRWVRQSVKERKTNLDDLLKFVDFKRIPDEFITYLSDKYGIECSAGACLKTCLKRYLSTDQAHPVPEGIFSDMNNATTIQVVVKYSGGITSPMRIFSLDPQTPNFYNIVSDRDYFDYKKLRTVVLKQPNDHLYCYGLLKGSSPVFRSYSSIAECFALHGESPVKLQCAPCKSNLFDICGKMNNVIYWYNRDIDNVKHYQNSGNNGGGNDEDVRRGIYRFDCETNRWCLLPEMGLRLENSSITFNDNVLYLMGGKKATLQALGYAQAYDDRTSSWMRLPESSISYSNALCCTLNGKIYVSNATVVECYDPRARKWELVASKNTAGGSKDASTNDSSPPPMKKQKANCKEYEERMVPFKNLLWIFTSNGTTHYTDIVDPYELAKTRKWSTSTILNYEVHRWAALPDSDESYNIGSATSKKWYCTAKIKDVFVAADSSDS